MPEVENLPPQTHSARDHVPPAVTYVPSDLVFACLIVIWIGAGLVAPPASAHELQAADVPPNSAFRVGHARLPLLNPDRI